MSRNCDYNGGHDQEIIIREQAEIGFNFLSG